MNPIIVWVAQGFYAGRLPVTPGSFGSLVGIAWVALLLSTRTVWAYASISLLAVFCSVWLCGKAEKILGQTDPSSVVFDEIVAIPFCFAGWLLLTGWDQDRLPGPESLFAANGWIWTLGIFFAFRFFDILKPWPVRQSQLLPGGWGVTIDDLAAAGYVNLVVLAAWGAQVRFS
jgi:phosphatidylglycerophosphatase A